MKENGNRNKIFAIAAALLVVVAFAIPIEHKYDKLFRFFSLTLIPKGLELPRFYDKKIYFYISDLIALALLCLGCSMTSWRRFFVDKGAIFLWVLFIAAAVSVAVSPLSHYPIPYIRLLQLLTPIALFCFLANALNEEEKPKITQILFITLVVAGLFQSGIAIAQYFHQGSLGLKLLGETNFAPHVPDAVCFEIQGGSRWTFDHFLSRSVGPKVVRVMGTLPHPNVLGGFLTLAMIGTYFLTIRMKKWALWLKLTLPLQFFALLITYSRSALFAWALATMVWFTLILLKQGVKTALADRSLRSLMLTIVLSGALSFSLLHEQILNRGGVLNYNKLASDSDNFRFFYQSVAFRILKKQPLTGVGYSQFSLHAPKFFPAEVDPKHRIGGVHNIYLFLASETGLLSLAAFLLFLGTLLRAAWRTPITEETATLSALFIAFLFIGGCDFYPILFQQGKLLLFLIAGLLAAHTRSSTLIGLKSNPSSIKVLL